MENIVIKKVEGKIEWVTLTPEQVSKLSDGSMIHLCWGNCSKTMCKHAMPSECKKVADRKKDIQNYDFITDGFQDLEDTLIVTKCNNYEPVGEKTLTVEQKRNIKQSGNSMITGYFGAENLEEAAKIHYMGIVDGTYEGDTIFPERMIIEWISKDNDAEKMLTKVLAYKCAKREEVTKNSEKKELEKSIKLVEDTLSSVISKREASEKAHDAEINKLMEKGIKENKIKSKK